MVSSSRIIDAESVVEVRQFKLEELRQDQGATGHAPRRRASDREGPPPGFQDGFRRGLEEGMRRGAASAAERLQREQGQRLQAIADEFSQRCEQLHHGMDEALGQVREEVAEQMIALSLELARQVIRAELRTHPSSIETVAREAIACLIDERASFQLHLNPDDAELLGPLLEPVLQTRGARLVPDQTIAAGGCRVHSASAEVDATLATRWQRVLASIGQAAAPSLEGDDE